MNITRVLLSIASFSFALVTGFKTGANINPLEKLIHTSVEVDTTPGVPIPNNDQFNLLLIGVDDAQKYDAKLQSIWIVAFPKDLSRLNLIPVFPSVDHPVQNLILAEAFHLHNSQPSQEFWNAMKETDTWWKGFFVSDKAGLTKLIDSLDGILVDGKPITGSQAVSSIPSWKSNPQKAIEQQQTIFESVCRRISTTNSSGTKNGIFLKTMNLPTNAATFIYQWVTKISNTKGLSCYFPTFVEIPISPTIAVP